MNILSISDVTGNHSHSSVAILQDGELTFALSQERISRIKNDSQFPTEAIEVALDYTGLGLADIDFFACGYPPSNYYGSLFRHGRFDVLRSFAGTMLRKPLTLSRYLAPNIKKGLFDPRHSNGLFDMGIPPEKFKFYDHHLAHVSAGYFSSDFDNALAISYGGFAPHGDGENVAGAIYLCQGDSIEHLDDIPMYASGCTFSGITVALGYRYMVDEGLTMGLAKTADHHNCYDKVRKLMSRYRNGKWRKYDHWVDYIMSPRTDAFLGTTSARRLLKLIDRYGAASIAAAAQRIWEKSILRLVRHYCRHWDVKNLVLTGGTFLNVQINSALAELEGIKNIYVHPHTGDGSTTIGAAIEAFRELCGQSLRLNMNDVGLGQTFDDNKIEKTIRRFGSRLSYEEVKNPSVYAAEQLANGKIIGWFQGREEYGPRSLGHRCLLADPRESSLKYRMTVDIKKRESWIPIAPSVLAEYGNAYFENFNNNPFMTRVYRAKPAKYDAIKSALHNDGTARAQAVDAHGYKPFRRLLEEFYKRTDMPMLLNSSLNRHGEPVVHRPEEALEMLLDTPMDELAIGSFVVKKALSSESG